MKRCLPAWLLLVCALATRGKYNTCIQKEGCHNCSASWWQNLFFTEDKEYTPISSVMLSVNMCCYTICVQMAVGYEVYNINASSNNVVLHCALA